METKMPTEREKWRTTGNGQGNYTSGGRNTKSLKKIMNHGAQLKEEKKKEKRYALALSFHEFRKKELQKQEA